MNHSVAYLVTTPANRIPKDIGDRILNWYFNKGYISIEAVADEFGRPIITEAWRILRMNTALKHLFIVAPQLNSDLRQIVSYSLLHGIKVGLILTNFGYDKLLDPVLKINSTQRRPVKGVHTCRSCEHTFKYNIKDPTAFNQHRFACPHCHMLIEDNVPVRTQQALVDAVLKDVDRACDTRNYQREQDQRTEQQMQAAQLKLPELAKLADQAMCCFSQAHAKTYTCETPYLPLQGVSTIQDALRQIAEELEELDEKNYNMPIHDLPHRAPFIKAMANSLADFGRAWGRVYELDAPANDTEAIAQAMQIVYYLSVGIMPEPKYRDIWEESAESLMWKAHLQEDQAQAFE